MADAINMEQIKKWAIIALASDDFLMQTLVLKGGNAIDLLQPQTIGNFLVRLTIWILVSRTILMKIWKR
ncbi:MAG: hypothetical protein WDO19_11475 [Bacteroidota bacterium]